MSADSDGPAQLGFGFADDKPTSGEWLPDPAKVRDDALAMLASAKAVTPESIWDQRTYRYNKVVFPQMTRWLPDEERNQLCFEFAKELERIELLMAA
ncbi:hypothetical protein [uncultured Erythrobacter sp.]|uniref:hypothetical protein n=1 Tax=uncultured Erythrobacter sp. TaxID=263913 RepID=UPI00265875CC|nr:hypothetical protein [uncultured Erythrobacter sp.]